MSPTYRLFRSVVAFAAGLALLVWSAQIPLTWFGPETSLLSFAMVLVASLGGVRLGLATVAAYVGLVMTGEVTWVGLDPVGYNLAADQPFGYLVGLLPGALLAAALSRRNGWLRLWLAGIVGHIGIFAVAVGLLARYSAPDEVAALFSVVTPYAWGAVMKSLFAATLVAIFRPPIDHP
ncbi:MAG: biotin transporter BioY [Myxococcota bacterium]